MQNALKEKLTRGEKPIGTFVTTGSAAVVECLGCAGLDFVILDNEHSPVEAETTCSMVRAAEVRGLTPLARVREISRPAILKLLDVGVKGLIVPNVRSAEEVAQVISYAKYYPMGQRGFCPSRKDGWGNSGLGSVVQTMDYFNRETLVIPQCETAEALAVTGINTARWEALHNLAAGSGICRRFSRSAPPLPSGSAPAAPWCGWRRAS